MLEARCGASFSKSDVYLNVAGGLKIAEPAADLAVAAALLSSLSSAPLPSEYRVFFGEVSLSGAVRPTGHMATRLRRTQKLGFKAAMVPGAGEIEPGIAPATLQRISHLKQLVERLGIANDVDSAE